MTMPRGPRGEQRPDDPVDAAILVARIATGAAEEPTPTQRRQSRQVFDLRVPDATPAPRPDDAPAEPD